MTLYLETSAAAKLFVIEAETPLVRQAVVADPALTSALITAAELLAAIAAATRARRILDPGRSARDFRAWWTDVSAVQIDEPLIFHAGLLAERHALRGYDAVQLAAAIQAAGGRPDLLPFCTFDARLRRAASAEGFPVPF